MSDAAPGLLDRAIRRLASVWREMATGIAREEEAGLRAQMRACLDGGGGEVRARARILGLAQAWLALDGDGRLAFLRDLASFDSDLDDVAMAWERVQARTDPAGRAAAMAELRRALEPARLRLLARFATIPGGVRLLVQQRAVLRQGMAEDVPLQALESDLRGLLAGWFGDGALELRRIDWTAPACLLEKLVGCAAVPDIRGWRDLKARLDAGRRCYAFFHPRIPDEPLLFVEVALARGLADSLQWLADRRAPAAGPEEADTALLHAVNACQPGLAGIPFGSFLVRQVIDRLAAEFPQIRQFATLSPVPGFRPWLDALLAFGEPGLLSQEEGAALRIAAPAEAPAAETGTAALAAILARPRFCRDPAMRRAAEPVLLRLCARYLLTERRGRRAADPVAHFHFAGGARLERINMLADTSEKGVRESATIMVNYVYDPSRIETAHEDYVGEGRRHASTAVRRQARGWG